MKRIIYFTSKTCAPCKKLLPQVEKLVAGANGQAVELGPETGDDQAIETATPELELVVVDIDENPSVAQVAGIMSVPTILFVTGIEPLTADTNRLNPNQARITNIRKKLEELDA